MNGWACTAWQAWGPRLVQPLPSRAPLAPPSRDRGLGTGLRPSLWLCCPLAVAGFSLQLQVCDERPAGPGTGPQNKGTGKEGPAVRKMKESRAETEVWPPPSTVTRAHMESAPVGRAEAGQWGAGGRTTLGWGCAGDHTRQQLLAASATPGWSVCPSPGPWPSLGQFWLLECGRSNAMQVPRLGVALPFIPRTLLGTRWPHHLARKPHKGRQRWSSSQPQLSPQPAGIQPQAQPSRTRQGRLHARAGLADARSGT